MQPKGELGLDHLRKLLMPTEREAWTFGPDNLVEVDENSYSCGPRTRNTTKMVYPVRSRFSVTVGRIISFFVIWPGKST